MESDKDQKLELITELSSLKEKPNDYLMLVVFVIGFFLLNYFYFETEMDSNYIGTFFVMILVHLNMLYKRTTERNKKIVRIIDNINSSSDS